MRYEVVRFSPIDSYSNKSANPNVFIVTGGPCSSNDSLVPGFAGSCFACSAACPGGSHGNSRSGLQESHDEPTNLVLERGQTVKVEPAATHLIGPTQPLRADEKLSGPLKFERAVWFISNIKYSLWERSQSKPARPDNRRGLAKRFEWPFATWSEHAGCSEACYRIVVQLVAYVVPFGLACVRVIMMAQLAVDGRRRPKCRI